MPEHRFGKLVIDPAKNPAVLGTATWDCAGASAALAAVPPGRWAAALAAAAEGEDAHPAPGPALLGGSWGRYAGAGWVLARLAGGQQVILASGEPGEHAPGPPFWRSAPEGSHPLSAFAADAAGVEWLLARVHPERGPKALGPVPRLGIGTRMSTAVWPGVWPALARRGLAANAIQNSVRELNLLDDLLAGRPPRENYMFGFGTLYEGHTGSTFEGLWLAGVLAALAAGFRGPFGADADHIMVKRGPGGLERARRVISAARHYTFFTLDVSDVLDYAALDPSRACDLSAVVPDARERRSVLSFHRERLDECAVTRAAAKHWAGLAAVEELAAFLGEVKGESPYDLELSIDETPPGIRALDCLTTEEETTFLLGEIRRRELPVTHIAPNLGVEKGSDYLGEDGLRGLEARTRRLHRLIAGDGLMLDCHSGDDLSPETRRAVGRATEGWVHFKISPMLQLLFARTLHELLPERFRFWWNDAYAFAAREAEKGSDLAARCLRECGAAGAARAPSPAHALFHHYGFATLGRRDPESGRFLHRERFYDLPAAFYGEYAGRVEALLDVVANDLFGE